MRAAALAVVLVVAALSGCASPEPRFARVHVADTAGDGGILVRAEIDSPGDVLAIRVHAENLGQTTWQVPSACADSHTAAEPWSIGIRPERAYDVRALPIYPAEGCGNVLLEPFPPGARREATFTWDGTYAHDDGRAHVSPGHYTLEAALEVYASSDQTPQPIVVSLPVQVLR